MNTITARFAGGDARAVATELMEKLDGLKVRDLSVTLRHSGNEMNPQIDQIALPDRDRSEDSAGILPGQDLNSPLEGPGFGSKESQASLIPIQIPEMSKEQKAASAANEKSYKAAEAETAKVTDEELAKREALEKEREEEWKEENRRAAARGVVPVGRPANPDAPDLKVAVVPNEGAPLNDNGLSGGSGTTTSSTSTSGASRVADAVKGAASSAAGTVRKAADRAKKATGR